MHRDIINCNIFFLKGTITQYMVYFHKVPLPGMYMFTGEGVCILVLPLSPDITPPVESQSQFGEPVPQGCIHYMPITVSFTLDCYFLLSEAFEAPLMS